MCFLLLQLFCASWDMTEGHLRAVSFCSDLSASASLCPGAVTLRPMATVLLYFLTKSSWKTLLCPLNLKGDLKKEIEKKKKGPFMPMTTWWHPGRTVSFESGAPLQSVTSGIIAVAGPPGVSLFQCLRRLLLWPFTVAFPRSLSCLPLWLLHLATRLACALLVVRENCSGGECIHNISLLFARQKMVLVIGSCWLHPAQQE